MGDTKRMVLGNQYNDGISASPSFTNFTLDGSTKTVEFIFQAPDDMVISKLLFRVSTSENSPEYKVSLQGVTDGIPDGAIKASGNAYALFTPDEYADGVVHEVTLGATYSAVRGEMLSVVIKHNSGTISAADYCSFSTRLSGLNGARSSTPYAATYNGTVRSKVSNGVPIFGISDGTAYYGNLIASVACSTFSTGSTPNERGVKFSVSSTITSTYKINGVRLNIQSPAASKTFDVILYDESNNVLQSITFDSDNTSLNGTTAYVPAEIFFRNSTLATLVAGTQYRLALKPKEADTALGLAIFTLSSAAHRACFDGGTQLQYTSRTDAGDWTDTPESIPAITPILCDLSPPLGGSGSGLIIE